MPHKAMTDFQRVKAGLWIENSKKWIATMPGQQTIARQAEKELGHKVTVWFVRNYLNATEWYGELQKSKRSPIEVDQDNLREAMSITIEVLEAVFGCEKELDCMRLEECGECTGSGVKAGTSPKTCGTCGGQGQVVATVRTPLGNFQQVTACNACGGSGQTFTPCSACGGDGRVRRSKRISLRVPAGVDSGSRLRVRGEGNAGRKGGPPGDLYVFVGVKDDPDLKRFESINVSSTVTIPYTKAILGTTQKVRTVDGTVDLKIPAGVQPGATLLMAKRGVPKLGQPNVRGDQYVTVKVTIPKSVSGKEKELVEELEGLSN